MDTNLYTDYYKIISTNKDILEYMNKLKQTYKSDISNICAWCKVTGKDKIK